MAAQADYDYVVVGAGAAGCVLADRLSASGEARVLVLEAGGADRRREFHIPAAWSKLFKSPADWDYTTTPQAELNGRQLYWPRGKVLGGSTSINAQMYLRGHRLDYDAWPQLGAAGWSYAEVLPYFRRSEGNRRGADAYHGADGPLEVGELRDPNPLTRIFLAAAQQAGLMANGDFNGAALDGVGLAQVTQSGGRRCSAADAFLRRALPRPNLRVIADALATRIVLDGRRAVGVAYSRGGREETAGAGREVILAGGAVNSPQLLMLSGIGPGEALRRHGIAVAQDLPAVGRNLQDHIGVGVRVAVSTRNSLKAARSLGSFLRFLLLHRGMLTSNVAEAAAFLRSRPDLPAPDIELLFGPVLFEDAGLTPPSRHGVTIGPVLLQPLSRGSITLASPDPGAKPIIDPGYLADPRDVEVLLHGIRIAMRVLAARAFAAVLGERLAPPSEATDEAALLSHLRQHAQTVYHPVGTCRIGRPDDAVVDPQLRVNGVAALRVADASVMPQIIRGHTQAPTMMIAERAAEWIEAAARAA